MSRAKKKPPHPFDGRKGRVSIERGGLCIVLDDVLAHDAEAVVAELLNVLRRLGTSFPELRELPETVPGSTGPTYVPEPWEEEAMGKRRKRVGF